MKRIIGPRASGKTHELLIAAKENNGMVVCADPGKMMEKAYLYGIIGVDVISYEDYRLAGYYDTKHEGKPLYVDELEDFVAFLLKSQTMKNLQGYCLTAED